VIKNKVVLKSWWSELGWNIDFLKRFWHGNDYIITHILGLHEKERAI